MLGWCLKVVVRLRLEMGEEVEPARKGAGKWGNSLVRKGGLTLTNYCCARQRPKSEAQNYK